MTNHNNIEDFTSGLKNLILLKEQMIAASPLKHEQLISSFFKEKITQVENDLNFLNEQERISNEEKEKRKLAQEKARQARNEELKIEYKRAID